MGDHQLLQYLICFGLLGVKALAQSKSIPFPLPDLVLLGFNSCFCKNSQWHCIVAGFTSQYGFTSSSSLSCSGWKCKGRALLSLLLLQGYSCFEDFPACFLKCGEFQAFSFSFIVSQGPGLCLLALSLHPGGVAGSSQ